MSGSRSFLFYSVVMLKLSGDIPYSTKFLEKSKFSVTKITSDYTISLTNSV